MNLLVHVSLVHIVASVQLFENAPDTERYYGNGDIEDEDLKKLHFASSNEEIFNFFKYEQSIQQTIKDLPWSKTKEAYLKMVDFK